MGECGAFLVSLHKIAPYADSILAIKLKSNTRKDMNDFRKYATGHLGMNGMTLDEVMKAQAQ